MGFKAIKVLSRIALGSLGAQREALYQIKRDGLSYNHRYILIQSRGIPLPLNGEVQE